jgi:hypothetical protein
VTKAKKPKRKPKRRIRKAIGRWAWRQIHNWAATQRQRIRKALAPKVIVASAKRHQWERQFPNPRRRRPLTETIERVDEWMAQFEAHLGNGWIVPFEVDIHDTRISLREAAYEAAVRMHGEIARGRTIVDVVPTNDLGEKIMTNDWRGR